MKQPHPFKRFLLAAADTLLDNWQLLLTHQILAPVKTKINRYVADHLLGTNPPQRMDRLASFRTMTRLSEDGAVTEGYDSEAWAKYAIPKGLPEEGERRLAIENDPHRVDDFDGVIEEGYGKGTKTLLSNQNVVVKVEGRSYIGKANYHYHEADVAGPHFDLVIEGVKPDTPSWEVNIPNGPYKGRYAYHNTDHGGVIIRMQDRSRLLPKPDYRLKRSDFFAQIREDPDRWIIERKLDGSLGNVHIHNDRAHVRSHRESASAYYDKLPQTEFFYNRSRLCSCRTLFPGPDHDGTVLQVELVHPDGAARVSGILNALPENAHRAQEHRGPVQAYVWDIQSYKGQDVTHLPYEQRRLLYEETVAELRLFNKNWHAIERLHPACNPLVETWYQQVIQDKRGLPYAEGIVVKDKTQATGDTWVKIKRQESIDVKAVAFIEGNGKYAGTLGALVVEDPATGARSEVGSFRITDAQRDLIWQHREDLEGQICEVDCFEQHDTGTVRAGTFVRWHPSKSEGNLFMYADSLAGSDDPEQAEEIKYRLINS